MPRSRQHPPRGFRRAGVSFNHGMLSNGPLSLPPDQLAGLTLTSDGESQHFDLTVTATVIDGQISGVPLDPLQTAATTQTLHVDVTPVADAPTLDVTAASGHEDQSIALSIRPALSEADPDAAITTITISGVPAGVIFNHGTLSNGTLSLTPDQLAGLTLTSDGETQHFDLMVTATGVDGQTPGVPLDPLQTASVSKTLHVDVTPVAEAPILN